MLTKLVMNNFKRFAKAEIELGGSVVFVGPNNSGKTTALQAMALWDLGVRKLAERYKDEQELPQKRPGVTINRKDLVALPVPHATMLWRGAHAFFEAQRIRIEIVVEGITDGLQWTCGLEFDYANEESFSCRPLRLSEDKYPARMIVPDAARKVRLAFLPPMSGLVASETKLDPGAVAVRIGEGRTAEVLRNLCYRVYSMGPAIWGRLMDRIDSLFGISLDEPEYLVDRGEIAMSYREQGVQLDLSSAGRGFQQTLLLLAYLYANPGAVLLLDEPDAHLEILRQREIYQVLSDLAAEQGSQIIAATHSEVVMNEAADRDMVVAFVGKPHRIDGRGGLQQVAKALKEIGFDQYYQAERKGWVLYLEGSTDLAILRSFAIALGHAAAGIIERPFFHSIGNQPKRARDHFYGLREAKPDLVGVAILDRDASTNTEGALEELKWRRREIENYLCYPEVLHSYAEQTGGAEGAIGPLFSQAQAKGRRELMRTVVAERVPPAALRDPADRWWSETKASGEFLDLVFDTYFAKLGTENLMRKSNYHQLAKLVPRSLIDAEIVEKLDAIVKVARLAQPVSSKEDR